MKTSRKMVARVIIVMMETREQRTNEARQKMHRIHVSMGIEIAS